MDFVTVVTDRKAINKRVTLEADGSISKEPAGQIADAQAQTVHVPDMDTFVEVYRQLGSRTDQTLILGSIPGTEDGEPYRLVSKQRKEELGDTAKCFTRTRDNFQHSSWCMFDYDRIQSMPPELETESTYEWLGWLRDLVPGMTDAGLLLAPSTSSRILMGGKPAFAAKGWHGFVQVKDASDVGRFGKSLLLHSMATPYGFMRPLFSRETGEVIGHRPWTVFDPTTFSPERLVYDGSPVVSDGLEVAAADLTIIEGGRLDTKLLEVTPEAQTEVKRRTGFALERVERDGVALYMMVNDRDLTLTTEVDTEKGRMTVESYWLSDHEKLRCQAVFRPDSSSQAAYLNRHADGAPFLFDVGTQTKFVLPAAESLRFRNQQAIKAGITSKAKNLAYGIKQTLCHLLEIDPESDAAERLGIDLEVLNSIVTGCFWSGVKSKVFMLGDDDDLLQFNIEDASGFITRRFGQYFDVGEVQSIAQALAGARLEASTMTKAEAAKFVTGVVGAPQKAVINHLKYHNQRDSVEWRVDMFATDSRIEIIEDKVRVVLKHKPLFLPPGHPEPSVIAEFKGHFTRLDDFIATMVYARFAADRKKAYLWIKADSDWGKGILLGALQQLGLVVTVSIKEVEAMLEGKPVGRSPIDFKRAFVLAVDEFKSVKSELKQLQSTIELSPKHQLSCSVEVFMKLFLSAENVPSLVGENGVEDQFANRMSVFLEYGSIENKPVFQDVGAGEYVQILARYIAGQVNLLVEQLRSLGRAQATKEAGRQVTEFHSKYGLGTVYQRFTDSLPDFAEQFLRWLADRPLAECIKSEKRESSDESDWYLLKPTRTLDDYIRDNLSPSEVCAMQHKKAQIIEMICADGRGVQTHRINGQPHKALKLRDPAGGQRA